MESLKYLSKMNIPFELQESSLVVGNNAKLDLGFSLFFF